MSSTELMKNSAAKTIVAPIQTAVWGLSTLRKPGSDLADLSLESVGLGSLFVFGIGPPFADSLFKEFSILPPNVYFVFDFSYTIFTVFQLYDIPSLTLLCPAIFTVFQLSFP